MSNQDQVNKTQYEQQLQEQQEKIKAAFRRIDKNSDDNIDEGELMKFLEEEGKNIEKESFRKLFKTLDTDNNGNISM